MGDGVCAQRSAFCMAHALTIRRDQPSTDSGPDATRHNQWFYIQQGWGSARRVRPYLHLLLQKLQQNIHRNTVHRVGGIVAQYPLDLPFLQIAA